VQRRSNSSRIAAEVSHDLPSVDVCSSAAPPIRRRAPRGVTLVELTVASAIASIVMAAATTSVVALLRNINEVRATAGLDAEAKLLTEYLVASSQGLGGGALRPWATIQVENNFDGSGSDRFTYFEINDDFGACTIEARPGNGVVFRFPTTPCCVNSSWEGLEAIASSPNGTFYQALRIGNTTSSPGNCQANFPPGLAGPGYDRLAGSATDWVGGTLMVGRINRVSMNSARRVLVLERDIDGDGDLDPIDLAGDVYDFQVALGYDINRNGLLADTGNTADEWFGNSTDTMGSGGLTNVTGPDLRMARFGITLGVRSGTPSKPVQLLNGPTRSVSGIHLRGTIGRALFRNLALFEL